MSVLDPNWVYTDSISTNLHATFARIRAQQEIAKNESATGRRASPLPVPATRQGANGGS